MSLPSELGCLCWEVPAQSLQGFGSTPQPRGRSMQREEGGKVFTSRMSGGIRCSILIGCSCGENRDGLVGRPPPRRPPQPPWPWRAPIPSQPPHAHPASQPVPMASSHPEPPDMEVDEGPGPWHRATLPTSHRLPNPNLGFVCLGTGVWTRGLDTAGKVRKGLAHPACTGMTSIFLLSRGWSRAGCALPSPSLRSLTGMGFFLFLVFLSYLTSPVPEQGGTAQPAVWMRRDSVPGSHSQALFLCLNPRREAERDLPQHWELARGGHPLGESGQQLSLAARSSELWASHRERKDS